MAETENGIEVYYSEIHQALQEYIADREIEDMTKETQNRWNAALIYIYNAVFKGTNKLKRDNYNTVYNGGSSNNNAYDIDAVNRICDYYIALCFEYDKEVSINGFSKLTGISTDCILRWGGKGGTYGNGIQDAGEAGLALHKKLTDERQESLSGMLISGKRPPVAILGALNRWYGWNMGQPQAIEKTDAPALSRDEVHQIAEQMAKTSTAELIGELPDE